MTGALLATVLLPGVAVAAPGDASARGVVVDLNGSVQGVAVVTANAAAGAADAPAGGGTDTDNAVDVAAALTGAIGVTGTGTVVQTTATRGVTASTASARVSGLDLSVLGVPVLATTGDVTATATCPATGALTADTTLAGLTVFGAAVTLTANTPATTSSAAVTVTGLTGAQLTATLTRVETTVDPNATAVAVRAALTLTGTAGGVPTTVDLGAVTIASATCQRPAAAPAAPDLTAITPPTGPTTGGTTVTITGANLTGTTSVTFDGVPATNVTVAPGGGSLTAVTPAHAAGPVDVAVTTPAGTDTLPGAFTYVAAAPTATGITPNSGPAAGGQTVTITGTGLADATQVTFDGVPATIVRRTANSVVVRTPRGAAGPAAVVVTTPAGTTAPLDYTYLAAPDATGLTPDSGPAAGGTTVTITGTGLAGATQVTFDGVPATIVRRTANSVVVRAPAHPAGAVDVAVTTPGGTDTLPDAFTYLPIGEVPGDQPRELRVVVHAQRVTQPHSVELGQCLDPAISHTSNTW